MSNVVLFVSSCFQNRYISNSPRAIVEQSSEVQGSDLANWDVIFEKKKRFRAVLELVKQDAGYLHWDHFNKKWWKIYS